jgi:hypothetical protein
MKIMLAVTTAGVTAGAFQCGAGRTQPCDTVVLEDTAQVYSSKDKTKVVMARKDTLPKPYATCLTIYAAYSDTVPKPR